jgi:hypothetical protein
MIILHAANFDRKFAYRALYNCDHKIRNGLVRAGHALYEFSDRDVARESNPFALRKLGRKAANRKFLRICETIRPGMILLGHADIVTNETLEQARALLPQVKIAYYNVDPLFVASNIAAINMRAGVVDSIYITTAGKDILPFAKGRTRVFFMPNPVDASLDTGRAFAHSDQPYDLLFCTVRTQAEDTRAQFMRSLHKRLPEIAIGFFGTEENPSVFGWDYLDLLKRTRMAVNLSKTCGKDFKRGEHYLYSSDRLAQVTGNGLLTFIDRASGLDDLYTADEAVFFDALDDLTEKVRFYKAHDDERRRIAEGGWKKAHAHFNSTLIGQYIVETSFALPRTHSYIWWP